MRKALIISLVLHVVIALTLITRRMGGEYNPRFSASGGRDKHPLQVKTLTEQEFQKKLSHALDDPKKLQIVQSDDQLKNDKAPDPNSTEKTFLSKNNQVVDKNTRAANVGKFKNVLKEGVQGTPQIKAAAAKASSEKSQSKDGKQATDSKVSEAAKPDTKEAQITAKDLFNLAPNPKDLEQQNASTSKTGRLRSPASLPPTNEAGQRKPGQGLSATDDYLQDIAVGANTMLNTKEFKFYSFYERIREKLSYQWHSRLDQEVQTIVSSGTTITADQRTKVEVHLDKRGQLVSIKVLHSSGYNGLDRAATQAFYMAAPFPNPPTAMIGDNNEVALSWDFVVVAQENAGMHVDIRQSGF